MSTSASKNAPHVDADRIKRYEWSDEDELEILDPDDERIKAIEKKQGAKAPKRN